MSPSLVQSYRFNEIRSIAIVGAGASGIVLAKALLAEGFTSIRIFERGSDIGGSWVYTSETAEPPCVPNTNAFTVDPPLPGTPPIFISPMYTNLWANSPRDIMTFEEKGFSASIPDFPFRTQIRQYLAEYGEEIRPLVEFEKEVINVEKQGKWRITIRDLKDPKRKTRVEQFDAVAIAAGHYEIPLIPNCPGIETFPAGKITHAKYFRHPATYKDKNVLLVGNGPSGADLANQLILTTRSIKRSVRSEANPLAITDPRVPDIDPIKRFNGNTIELVDGTELTDIDTVIFCTGYLYSLPMFPKEMGFITPDGAYVHHLYDQTFYCEDPTLTFIGLPKQVLPFPTFQNQAIVVAKVWAQKLYLPPVEEMRKEELERLEMKVEPKLYHSFKYPEDVELAERWRRWIEEDKSPGWEKRMKPWRWTDERKEIRKNAIDIKKAFLKTIEEGRLDHMMLDKA